MLFLFYFLSYETVLKVQCSLQIGKYQFPPEGQSLSSSERTKKIILCTLPVKGPADHCGWPPNPYHTKKKKKKKHLEKLKHL